MDDKDLDVSKEKTLESGHEAKKPYQDPAFRHERVFETMALACGKVNASQLQCRFRRMSS